MSADAARAIYGVVIGRNGEADAAATATAREGIRFGRKKDAVAPTKPRGARDRAADQLSWGGALTLTHRSNAMSLSCGHCGEDLGQTGASWRDVVGRRNPQAAELGPHVKLDERFVFEQMICPNCATCLWIDTRKRDEKPVVDFSLA